MCLLTTQIILIGTIYPRYYPHHPRSYLWDRREIRSVDIWKRQVARLIFSMDMSIIKCVGYLVTGIFQRWMLAHEVFNVASSTSSLGFATAIHKSFTCIFTITRPGWKKMILSGRRKIQQGAWRGGAGEASYVLFWVYVEYLQIVSRFMHISHDQQVQLKRLIYGTTIEACHDT